MPDTSLRRQTAVSAAAAAEDARLTAKAAHDFSGFERPITAPVHALLTSPARSHPNAAHAKELPLHLIYRILSYLDNVGDLARITRSSRLFYYMALPQLYENVTLRSHAEMRFNQGRPEGYGSGSPFTMGLNTLVSRTFTNYIQRFRLAGEWHEKDDDYLQGRVPDSSMVLQIAIRAALDKMKNLQAFAWELNTKPLSTVYQGLMDKPRLTSLTIRCQTSRVPRPTSTVPPLPSLLSLIVYDFDPLCYPDDFSLLLLSCKKLENLKIHWSPRMRESGEESINLMAVFGRLIPAKQLLPLKRIAFYNLYTRFNHGVDDIIDPNTVEEFTFFNCMGSSNPMTVFLDDTWKARSQHHVHPNLKMIRVDIADKQGANMLASFRGLERFYLVRQQTTPSSRASSDATTPATPAAFTPGLASGSTSINGTPNFVEYECRNVGSEYIALIRSHHQTMRHLLLLDLWQLSTETLVQLCQSCPNLEQLGFNLATVGLESLREIITVAPKLRAIRLLTRAGSELAETIDSMDPEMHQFAMSIELWRPEYKNLKYVGLGDKLVFKLGGVYFPPKSVAGAFEEGDNSFNAKKAGPRRIIHMVTRESVKDVEIWGMDSTEFDPKFP